MMCTANIAQTNVQAYSQPFMHNVSMPFHETTQGTIPRVHTAEAKQASHSLLNHTSHAHTHTAWPT